MDAQEIITTNRGKTEEYKLNGAQKQQINACKEEETKEKHKTNKIQNKKMDAQEIAITQRKKT